MATFKSCQRGKNYSVHPYRAAMGKGGPGQKGERKRQRVRAVSGAKKPKVVFKRGERGGESAVKNCIGRGEPWRTGLLDLCFSIREGSGGQTKNMGVLDCVFSAGSLRLPQKKPGGGGGGGGEQRGGVGAA